MKKMISRMLMAALAAIFICGGVAARATTLTGTVNNPDGSAFNGVIYLTLSQAGTVSSSGTCGGPIYVSNTYKVAVQVVAGAIVSSPQIYDSNCFTTPGIPYSVQLVSQTGAMVSQIWVITSTPLQTGSENVGTIIPVTISGVVFSIPAAANITSLLFGTTSIPLDTTAPSGSTNYLCNVGAKIVGCAGGSGGSMTWPSGGAGIPNYNGGSAYGTSYNASNTIPSNFLSLALQSGTTAATQSVGDSSNKVATDAFVIANAGSGGYPSIQVEHTFTGAGSFNFAHGLADEYPLTTCFSLSGGSAYSATPVDVNNMQITVSAAATILCSFQATAQLNPNFGVAISPSSQSYTIVGSGTQTPTYTVTQTPVNGYTGTVTYSVTGLASGITPSFSPSTITGSGSSTLTLSFPSSQATGTDTFTVSATDGTLTHTTPGSLTIAPASGDFAFTVTPSSFTYTPSMTGTQTPTFAIAQTVTGSYSGTVTYSSSGLASGMSGSYSPTTITGAGSNTLSVSFPATQAAGLTTITLQGSDGTLTHTNPLALTISNINQSLVDGWQMNAGSGFTFADATANANTMTSSSGCGSWGTVAGIGTAFTFNGTCGANGANATVTAFNGSTPFSITAWVTFTNTGNWEVIADNMNGLYTAAGAGIIWTRNNSSHLYVQIQNSSSNGINIGSPGTTLSTGTPYFVALTYDGSKTAAGTIMYVNGTAVTPNVLMNSLTGSTASTTPFSIATPSVNDPVGGFIHTGAQAFTRIYSRALSSADITAMYAAGPK